MRNFLFFIKANFWLYFFRILKWRTHDVFIGIARPPGNAYFYIGAMDKKQRVTKNIFHKKVKVLGRQPIDNDEV